MNERKKNVLVSVLLIIIFVLIFIIMYLLLQSKSKVNNNNNEQENNISDIEISLNDDLVKKLISNISFKDYVLASIYKNGDFDKNNIPNDLVLRISSSKIFIDESGNFNTSSDLISDTDYCDNKTWIIPNIVIKEQVKNIFGNLDYNDSDFVVVDITKFGGYTYIDNLKYDLNNKKYIVCQDFGGGASVPYIIQKAYKAVKRNNFMDIYVKTSFVNVINDEKQNEISVLYRDYNFDNNEFMGEVIKTDEFNTIPTNEFDKFNTYIYTFEYDENNNYYLYSFKKDSNNQGYSKPNDDNQNNDYSEIYNKYSDIEWARTKLYDGARFIIEDNNLKAYKPRGEYEIIEVKGLEGTPIKITYEGVTSADYYFVLTDKGKVYDISPNMNGYEAIQILKDYKIIDMTLPQEVATESSKAFFLTSNGELIDMNGSKYEQLNPIDFDRKIELCNQPSSLFYDKENHIYYFDVQYKPLVDKNGKSIVAKEFYEDDVNIDKENFNFEFKYVIVDVNNKLYLFDKNYKLVNSEYDDKIINQISDKQEGSSLLITITFTDGTQFVFNKPTECM